METKAQRSDPWISVVVPAYNEQEVLPTFHERLSGALAGVGGTAEIVYVNDGSRDGTLEAMHRLKAVDPRVAIVDLSRNFGKEVALTAGLDHARGAAVVVIDADLQEPPELIPKLIERWRDGGYDVVYAQRVSRAGETWLKKSTAHLFYRMMQRFGEVSLPPDTGDFRLLSRRAVDAILRLRERHRFMKGLFAWIGFSQAAVQYDRDPRHAGATKWNYGKLWNLAIEGFTSSTVAPLRLAGYFGFAVAGFAFLFGLWIIYKTLVFGEPVQGYPTLMVTVLFLGGTQLLSLAVLGEYLGRVFNETKARPLYLVNDYVPSSPGTPRERPAGAEARSPVAGVEEKSTG
jgi:polyisoprenyl-phosphate glycosyltransferase